MRLKLELAHLPQQRLPINYQNLISNWLFQMLYLTDPILSAWLHDNGYDYGKNTDNYFCYTMLKPALYTLDLENDSFEMTKGPTSLEVSFYIPKEMEERLIRIFRNRKFSLKNGVYQVDFEVKYIKIIKELQFYPFMKFSCVTPICISKGAPDSPHPNYIEPGEDGYAEWFIKTVVKNANAYVGHEKFSTEGIRWRMVGKKISSKKWQLNDIEVKGKLYDFEWFAPVELTRIAYYGGFGIQNATLGMGMVRLYRNTKR